MAVTCGRYADLLTPWVQCECVPLDLELNSQSEVGIDHRPRHHSGALTTFESRLLSVQLSPELTSTVLPVAPLQVREGY